MGDFTLIFQILGGLLAIFFIFLTVMNTKTWQWLHVTALFLVFASVVGFAVMVAQTLKARFAWVKAHDKLAKQLDEQEKTYHDLIYGNPSAPDGGQDSLIARRSEFSRFVLDRGRVFRNCTAVLNADGMTVTVQLPAPAAAPTPAAPPAGPPPAGAAPPAEGAAPPAAGAAVPAATAVKSGFKAQEVVYAFLEGPDPLNTEPANPRLVPRYYLGQFEITAATDQTLTLLRRVPPGAVVQGDAPPEYRWTIYETLPGDMHEVFDVPVDKRAQELAKIFPPLPENALPALKTAYARMIADYQRDGQPAEDTDPPENVWIKVQFQQDQEVVVDAAEAAAPGVSLIDLENFNTLGEAQNPHLHRKEPVKFKKGDTAIFDSQTATGLLNSGVASLAEGQARIFRRRLNDYENSFATISRRIGELAAEIGRADRHLAELKVALDKANEQIRIQEAEKTLLTADLTKGTYEGTELGKYRDALQAKVAELRAELSRLYGANKQLRDDLKAASDRLTEEIDRRTREATAAASGQ